jgi:phage baseplate assembly protein W
MIGTSRQSARPIEGTERLAQSIGDILTTPKGSRVMRRDYGSDLPLLIDAPMNDETMVDIYAATAEAIDRWEPEFAVRRVELVSASAGRMELRLTGDDRVLDIEVAA